MSNLNAVIHDSDIVQMDDINFEFYSADTNIYEIARFHNNQRKSVRYVRKDVTVFISQADIFGFYSLFSCSCAVKVKLFDISSRGVLIGGPSRLRLKKNQKILLTVIFNTNKTFEISAKVAREIIEDRRFYGIKFDKVNDELGDYLVESQTDLVFK